MKTPAFLLNKPQSIKHLIKYLKNNPRLVIEGEVITFHSSSKECLMFKRHNGKFHIIGFPLDEQVEWGMNFYDSRFVYSRSDHMRKYFYED